MNDILFFDDFYEDPFYIRDQALKLKYHLSFPQTGWDNTKEKSLWPGLATSDCILPYTVDVKVSKLLGKIVRSGDKSGFFRISKADDTSDYFVHTDGLPNLNRKKVYSGIIYLTPDIVGIPGTLFYKHIPSQKIKTENANDLMSTSNDFKLQNNGNCIILFHINLTV